MYLHLGNNQMVAGEDVIMILDLKKIQRAADARKFIDSITLDKGQIIYPEGTKSVIVTTKSVFFSPISPVTLLKRAEDNIHLRLKPFSYIL